MFTMSVICFSYCGSVSRSSLGIHKLSEARGSQLSTESRTRSLPPATPTAPRSLSGRTRFSKRGRTCWSSSRPEHRYESDEFFIQGSGKFFIELGRICNRREKRRVDVSLIIRLMFFRCWLPPASFTSSSTTAKIF